MIPDQTRFQPAQRECTANRQAREFGNHGRRGNTIDLHAEYQHKQQVQDNVGDVDCQHDVERYAGILQADEPTLRWFQLVDQLLSMCQKLGVRTIITLGSMYDNVLHTDRIVSGVASTEDMASRLMKFDINPIDYQGPSAIHTIIHSEGSKRGFECISLWSHSPYYLQGTTHFGLLSHMGGIIAELANFQIDTPDLEANWKKLKEQINRLIDGNSELQSLISSLRKEKVKGMEVISVP